MDSKNIRRIHTFLLPPGILGGLYSASFSEEKGTLHRLVLSYMQPGLLEWDLKPLHDILKERRIPQVDGRIEIGRNTGDALSYFLPSVGEKESAAEAEKRRQTCFEDWLKAAGEETGAALALQLPQPIEKAPVACATRGRLHFLFRLDATGGRTLASALAALGEPQVRELGARIRLCRDIMGEWRTD